MPEGYKYRWGGERVNAPTHLSYLMHYSCVIHFHQQCWNHLSSPFHSLFFHIVLGAFYVGSSLIKPTTPIGIKYWSEMFYGSSQFSSNYLSAIWFFPLSHQFASPQVTSVPKLANNVPVYFPIHCKHCFWSGRRYDCVFSFIFYLSSQTEAYWSISLHKVNETELNLE